MMSNPGKSGLRLSSSALRMEEEAKASERGIKSILGSEFERPRTDSSFRRTMSADMSSKKWLEQYGVSQLKKVASSEGSSSSESEGEEEYRERKKELEKTEQLDSWSSILSMKQEDSSKSSSLPAPDIHPLVKKPARSLSAKSLEICTESLGSESGSEIFPSSPSSESGEDQQEDDDEKDLQVADKEETSGGVTYNFTANKISSLRSIPPPLPSLRHREKPELRMRSHRKDGRLVIEAVSVSSYNYFHPHREDGCLLLTLINSSATAEIFSDEQKVEENKEEEEEEDEDLFDADELVEELEGEEEQEMETSEKEGEIMEEGIMEVKTSESPLALPSGLIKIHRSAPSFNRPKTNENPVPSWSPKLLKIVGWEDPTPLPQSLPTRLPVAPPGSSPRTAASINAYEYGWRSSSVTTGTLMKSSKEQQRGNNADYLDPLLSGCKEARRSKRMTWEPYCIATS